MKYKHLFLLSLAFLAHFFIVNVYSQNIKENDSLLAFIENNRDNDTLRINSLATYGELNQVFRYGYWDSISKECEKVLLKNPDKKTTNNILKIHASVINNLGIITSFSGNLDKTLEFFKKGLEINKKLNNKPGIAEISSNIAQIYNTQGKVSEALDYYNNSLSIYEKLNNDMGKAQCLNKIGLLYTTQGEHIKALTNHKKSLEIFEALKNKKGAAECYSNIATILHQNGDPNCKDEANCLDVSQKAALDYYNKALAIFDSLNNKKSTAVVLANIGSIYNSYGDPYCELNREKCKEKGQKIGIVYAQRSLNIRREMKDELGTCSILINLGYAYYNIKNYSLAKKHAQEGFNSAKVIGLPKEIREAAFILHKLYLKENNYSEALKLYKLHIQMRDSIKNESNQKATARQEARFEYEKQKAIDEAEYEKQLAIEQEAKEKQTILTYATGGGLGLVGIFLLIVFNRLKVTRKQKNIIEEQKQEVEHQKEVVEQAHSELEEKNKEITDSIQYAKRIQNAILPPNKVVKEYLQESFILYKPKDIVAGDFYWLETVSDEGGVMSDENPTLTPHHSTTVLFAAADCTGHGVPGAMVSVVCNNGLNRSVREYGLTDPGKILDKTREIVVEEFRAGWQAGEKSEEEVKDGMDIALCSLSVGSNQQTVLKYAGAHNPLWIITPCQSELVEDSGKGEVSILRQAQDDTPTLLETKANKQPIGKFDNPEPYTTHTIELQKGDSVYIFSDGYADQFGGDNGKKLKTANFKKLLLSIQTENMQKQKELIDEAFESWKGNLEQLDDVCVIGVRV